MLEEYLQMRKAGHIDLGWFYKFYLQEFDKLSPTYESKVKDMFGGSLFIEVRPGEYLHKTEIKERVKLDFNSFAQAFGIGVTIMANEIFEYCDKFYNVTKIEEANIKSWKQVEQHEVKLFYIG